MKNICCWIVDDILRFWQNILGFPIAVISNIMISTRDNIDIVTSKDGSSSNFILILSTFITIARVIARNLLNDMLSG